MSYRNFVDLAMVGFETLSSTQEQVMWHYSKEGINNIFLHTFEK